MAEATDPSSSNFKRMSRDERRSELALHKKFLRDVFPSHEAPYEIEMPEDTRERALKLEDAKHYMVMAGCSRLNSEGEYEFQPLKLPPSEIGQYGVGCQLYFEWLWYLGLIFFVLFLFSTPLLHFYVSGSLIEDVEESRVQFWAFKLMAYFTPGNVGVCSGRQCLTEEGMRTRRVGKDSEQFVSDLTPVFGVLDLFGCLIFLFFCLWFRLYRIPRVVREQDEANVTAADFGVEVSSLPMSLWSQGEHLLYEQRLREHFGKVLLRCGVPEQEAASAVREVAMIRDYGGCILKFQDQGNLLEDMNEQRMQYQKAKLQGHQALMDKWKDKVVKTRLQIIELEKLMKPHDMKDEERDVCGAFVMFDREDYKQKVIDAYAPTSSSYLAKTTQQKALQFFDNSLYVTQACEPTDLFWENLDYGFWRHKVRKIITMTLCILILFCSIFILNFFRAETPPVNTTSPEADAWFFRIAQNSNPKGTCLNLCELHLFSDAACKQDMHSDVESIWTEGGQEWDLTHPYKLNALSLFDGNTNCEVSNFSTPHCTDKFYDEGRIGITLLRPTALKCLHVQGHTDHDFSLEVYGCTRKDLMSFDGEFRDFNPEKYCTRHEDVVVGNDFQKNEHVRLTTYCQKGRADISPAAARKAQEEARNRTQNGKDAPPPRVVDCYCQQEIAKDIRLRGGFGENKEAAEICNQFITDVNHRQIMKVLGILFIVTLNQVLLALFNRMDAMGRYRTATELAKSQMINLFLAEGFNTALIYYLVGVNVYDSFDDTVLSDLKFGQGNYSDVSTMWFIIVGTQLVVVIAIQAIWTFVFPVAWVIFVDPLLRWFCARGLESQELLNEAHQLPEWTLSLRIAENLVIVFCVVAYTAGFPLLYLCGAVYCFFSYWCDKYALLKGSCKPPSYSQELIERAVNMMPVAIAAHVAFSMWVFGNQSLCPSKWGSLLSFMENIVNLTQEEYDEIMQVYAGSGTDVRARLFRRFVRARCLDCARLANEPLLILFIAMLCWYGITFLAFILRPFIGRTERLLGVKFHEFLMYLRIQKDAKDTSETLCQVQQWISEKKPDIVMSYRLDKNPKYEEAVEALQLILPDEMIEEALHGESPSFVSALKTRLHASTSKLSVLTPKSDAHSVHSVQSETVVLTI